VAGFVGIVADHPGRTVSHEEIAPLVAAHERLHGTGRPEVLDAGGRGVLALFSDRVAPFLERAGASWAAGAGTVHAPGPLLETPSTALDGQFALVTHDALRGQTTVLADPLGMFAAFVARRDGLTFVSTSLLALAAHLRAEPDLTGIAGYLLSGYGFGRRTAWEGIERLDPAARLVFGPRGRREDRAWRPEVSPAVRLLALEPAADACIEGAVGLLRARLGGSPPLMVDLTGGFDTRLLALLVRRAGIPFETNTVGVAGSRDVVIAEALAREAGWSWHRRELPPDWPQRAPELLPAALVAGNGQLDALQLAEVLWGHGETAARHARLLNGGGGEIYKPYPWAQEFLRAGRTTRVNMDNWVDMRLLGPFGDDLLAQDLRPAVRADFAARMRERAQPYAHAPNTTQLEVMYAYKNMGHFGAYATAAREVLAVELPFYWREVYADAFSTRPALRDGLRLQRAMMARLDPRLADLETDRGGPAGPRRARNAHRFLPFYRRQLRGLVPKVSHRLLGRRLLPERGELAPAASAGRRAALRALDLRPEAMRSAPLYRAEALRGLLAGAARPEFDAWPLLGRVATIELALRAADAALDPVAGRGRARPVAQGAGVSG